MDNANNWAMLGVGAAWLGLLTKWLSWTVNTNMRMLLSDFKEKLTAEFGDRFQDSKLAAARMEPLLKEMTDLRAKINAVEDYAHRWRHAHAGPLQRCILTLKIESSKDEF